MSQGLRRTEGSFAAPDAVPLFRRAWLPSDVARAMILVHGFGEHSGRYDEVGAWFAARGCAVHAYDQRGHGRSGGPRTHVEKFSLLLDDLAGFQALVREEHPGVPLVLVAHSMGGLVALSYLAERRPTLSGAIVSGPALAAERAVPRARVWLARTLGRLFPTLRLQAGLDLTGLSRDEAVLRRYLADPLVERTMTASLGAELLAAGSATRAKAASIAVPVLMMHGKLDTLCPVEASEQFAAELRAPGSELRVYPELRHEIFNEPERERVFADAWRWIEGTLA